MSGLVLVEQCRLVVHQLLGKYQWRLLTEADFVVQLAARAATQAGTDADTLLKLAKTLYSEVWYEACQGSGARREQAFAELAFELHKLARQKYGGQANPHAVEEITHTALILIWEQLASCHSPAAFMKFCFYKLWNAGTIYLRAEQKTLKYTIPLPDESEQADD